MGKPQAWPLWPKMYFVNGRTTADCSVMTPFRSKIEALSITTNSLNTVCLVNSHVFNWITEFMNFRLECFATLNKCSIWYDDSALDDTFSLVNKIQLTIQPPSDCIIQSRQNAERRNTWKNSSISRKFNHIFVAHHLGCALDFDTTRAPYSLFSSLFQSLFVSLT